VLEQAAAAAVAASGTAAVAAPAAAVAEMDDYLSGGHGKSALS
jgi:hypothetical protein